MPCAARSYLLDYGDAGVNKPVLPVVDYYSNITMHITQYLAMLTNVCPPALLSMLCLLLLL